MVSFCGAESLRLVLPYPVGSTIFLNFCKIFETFFLLFFHSSIRIITIISYILQSYTKYINILNGFLLWSRVSMAGPAIPCSFYMPFLYIFKLRMSFVVMFAIFFYLSRFVSSLLLNTAFIHLNSLCHLPNLSFSLYQWPYQLMLVTVTAKSIYT